MSLFKRKEKLKETPVEELKCGCGHPIPPPYRTVSDFYGQIIVEHKKVCRKCEKINITNG